MAESPFKAYDLRGKVPEQLNEELAYRIGQAYADFVRPRQVAVGRDIRLSGPSLSVALQDGLTSVGVDVQDIGVCGTEELYFATFHDELDGGIMVTASHNPKDYNGMKFVREKGIPISSDTGLKEIERLAQAEDPTELAGKGKVEHVEIRRAYVNHLLNSVDLDALEPYRIVANPGNGCAGPVLELLQERLPFDFVKIQYEPDGAFPNGVPNPLLIENRATTADAVVEAKADLGIAWDGDFDRCFFFDETGRFIESYYVVGFLAAQILDGQPGEKIVHDPRLRWNTIEMVLERGGTPVQSKSGHAFIKEKMRQVDAIYGGEMSAHHYFREFSYCDSGMLPWLMMVEIMSRTGKKLSQLVEERMELYPVSGEINLKIEDPPAAIERLRSQYAESANVVDETDGLSLEFEQWRFNVRMSNTEPVVRLNVEAKRDKDLLDKKTRELVDRLS